MAWYEDMFGQEDPLRLEGYAEDESSRKHVDFVIEKLGVQPGARILDLCCGQGRHLLDLMRRGYELVGLDLSEYMLSKCREAAAKEGIEPSLIRADMRELDFTAEFDAVINLWTSFGYLESEDEDQKVLDGVSRALKWDGRFFLDVSNRDGLMKRYTERRWQDNARGDIVIIDSRFDCMTGRNNVREITIRADGRRTENTHSLRMYTYQELEGMLKNAGLTIESVWGDYDSSAFTLASKRMLVISVKAQ